MKYNVRKFSDKLYIVSYKKKAGWGFNTFSSLTAATNFGKKKSSTFIIYKSTGYAQYSKKI